MFAGFVLGTLVTILVYVLARLVAKAFPPKDPTREWFIG